MKMPLFLKKLLRRNKKEKQQALDEKENKPIMKKFDIIVYSEDEGRGHQRTENGVFAENAKQLISLYAGCGEKIQIIKEYEDPNAKKEVIDVSPQITVPEPSTTVNNIPNNIISPTPISTQNATVIYPIPANNINKNEPPKYFNICGTECKFENGKIYQKQWVKILGTEASQYRIISDVNNKEFSLKGKHIEMLKWVLIQNDSNNENNDVNTSIRQILNG